MKKRKRFWISFIIVIGCLLLPLILGVYLSSGPGENYLKARLQDWLARELQLQVRIEKFETNLWSRIQCRGVEIRDSSDDSFLPVGIGSVRIDYSVWRLPGGFVRINNVLVDSLKLNVRRDSLGFHPALPESSQATDKSFGTGFLRFSIDRAVLTNTALNYEDRIIGFSGRVYNFSCDVGFKPEGVASVRMKSDSCRLTSSGREITATRILLDNEISRDHWRIRHLSLMLPGVSVEGEGQLPVPVGETEAIDLALHFKGDPGPIFQSFLANRINFPGTMVGLIDAEMRLSGPPENLLIYTRVCFPTIRLDDILVQNGEMESCYSNGRMELKRMSMETFGGTVYGSGWLKTGEAFDHHLELSIHQIGLADVMQYIYRKSSPYSGAITGSFKSEGGIRDPGSMRMSAWMDGTDLFLQDRALSDFHADFLLRSGKARLSIVHEESRIVSEGMITRGGLQGDFSVNIPLLEIYAGLVNVKRLSGAVMIRGQFAGTLTEPEMNCMAEGRGLLYQGLPVDSLDFFLSYRNKKFHFQDLKIRGSIARIDSSSPPFDLRQLRGGMRYQADVSGNQDSLTGTAELRMEHIEWNRFHFDESRFRFSLEGRTIRLVDGFLSHESDVVFLEAEYRIPESRGTVFLRMGSNMKNWPGEKRWELYENMDMLSFKNITENDGSMVILFQQTEGSWKVAGSASALDLAIAGCFFVGLPKIGGSTDFRANARLYSEGMPEGELYLSVNRPMIEGIEADSMHLHVLFDQCVYLDSAVLYTQGDKSWIEGDLDFSGIESGELLINEECATHGHAQITDLNVGILKPVLDPNMDVQGNLNASVSWNGFLGAPGLKGNISLTDGYIQRSGSSIPMRVDTIEVSIADSMFTIRKLSGSVDELPVRALGTVVYSTEEYVRTDFQVYLSGILVFSAEGTIGHDSISMRMKTDNFNLSLIQPFFPVIDELHGELISDLQIEGTAKNPSVAGEVVVRRVTFRSHLIDETITDGTVKIRLTPGQLHLDSLIVPIDKGILSGNGDLTYTSLKVQDFLFTVQAEKIELSRPKIFIANIQKADITFQKLKDAKSLSGDIILGESKITVDFPPRTLLSLLNRIERPSKPTSSWLKETPVSIRIRASDRIWLDNNLARMRMRLELEMIGTLAKPVITGRLSVEEGYALYLDRKFKVERGILDFINPYQTEPVIDLKAVANIKNYQTMTNIPYNVTLGIKGPLNQAVVTLESDPYLDRANIIALLTLGMTREQLGGKTSESMGGSLGEALQQRIELLSSRSILGFASQKFGNLFGLQQMTIEGNLFRFGKSWGPQLLASKKLTEKMEITYSTTVGYMNQQNVRLDYRLSSLFTLQGQTDQRGQSGLDLKYHIKF